MALDKVPLGCKEFDEICMLIRNSYPDSCVIWVDRVVNDALDERYADYVSKLQDAKELRVFHGTSVKNIRAIVAEGFDPSKNVRSAFGRGNYFATSAAYSKGYTDTSKDELSHMFVCKLAVGKTCQGTAGTDIGSSKFDCAVDNVHNPTIYVSPHASASIPEYLVAFHKNAA